MRRKARKKRKVIQDRDKEREGPLYVPGGVDCEPFNIIISVLGPVRVSFNACILLVVAHILFQLLFSCSVLRVWGIFIKNVCMITMSNLVSFESS